MGGAYNAKKFNFLDNFGNWIPLNLQAGFRILQQPHKHSYSLQPLVTLNYRRDWLIGACAYRLQQQENMRLLYVCAY